MNYRLTMSNWRKSTVFNELIAIGVIAILAYMVSSVFDTVDFIHELSSKYEKWDIDEFLIVFIVLVLSLSFFSIRRWREAQREIAQRKRAEERLMRQSQELKRSNAELEQFAHIASHDLQEPLRMVTNYVQLLAQRYEDRLDADADDFIAYAVDGTNRMRDLINDLLSYARVSMRGRDFVPTNCETVFERTLANLRIGLEENGAAVTHDPLPTVMADDLQLVQLLQNLIGNAIKFRSEEPPRVHVSVRQRGNEWVFFVRDNGIGIDPEYADRIFITFQRLHDREKYPGTGIGLAICKKIVERYGGRIWVESQPGKGSTFYFTMPVMGASSYE